MKFKHIFLLFLTVVILLSLVSCNSRDTIYTNENYDKLMQYYHYYESIEEHTDYLTEELYTYYSKVYHDDMKILDSIEELENISTEICDFIDANSSLFDTFDIYTDKSSFKDRYNSMLDKINNWYDINQRASKHYLTDMKNESFISSCLTSIERCLGISDIREALEKFN